MPPRNSAAVAEVISVMPDFDDEAFDDAGDEQSMDQVLLAAGAKRDRRGNWFRRVPDPKVAKRRVVENGKVYIETSWVQRPVAVAASWPEALEAAKKTNGQADALIPGVGWVRGGVKIEREHPDNVGTLTQVATARTTREEVEPDVVAAEQAIALRPTLEAVAAGAGASRQPRAATED